MLTVVRSTGPATRPGQCCGLPYGGQARSCRSSIGLFGCKPPSGSGYFLVGAQVAEVGARGTPSRAPRPCRRLRPTGRCWVGSAGMPAGYPRSPIGLFGCKPPSGYFLMGAQVAEVGAQARAGVLPLAAQLGTRPCRRLRPTGRCWVPSAGMPAGDPRSPIGLFGQLQFNRLLSSSCY